MKAYRHIGLPVLLTVILVAAAGCPNVVFFADKALESAIRAELHQPFGPLTQQDLLDVQQISAAGLGIRDLSGIEYCKNLAELNLAGNQISSIKPLEQLGHPASPFSSPLTHLNLNDNEIWTITPLAGLLNLVDVQLFGNQIASIKPLVTNAQNGGLGAGDHVVLDASTLSEQVLSVDVPTLQNFQVYVTFSVPAASTDG